MRFCGNMFCFFYNFLRTNFLRRLTDCVRRAFLWLEAFPGERKACVGGVPLEIK